MANSLLKKGLLVSLLATIAIVAPTLTATAAQNEVKWDCVDLPAAGNVNGWVLASGSDVKCLSSASDGTLYAYANPTATGYTLFKSTDGGYHWSYTGRVEAEIVAIATDPGGADGLYYATSTSVYKSDDGGDSFTQFPPNPGGADGTDIKITDLSVANLDDRNLIAVATADCNLAAGGGIYTLEETDGVFPSWQDTGIGDYNTHRLALSPDFESDGIMVALITDDAETYIAYNYGTPGDWEMVELLDDDRNSFVSDGASEIVFPPGFDEPYPIFIGLNGGDGGVYRVTSGDAERLDGIDAHIASLDSVGEEGAFRIIAGEKSNGNVWYSEDSGESWDEAVKPPSGGGMTGVVFAPGPTDGLTAYASTAGSDSAVSLTTDGGETWNQIGLIDTGIDALLDLGVSPDHDSDGTLFLLSWGGEHSLWRTQNDAGTWERVFTSSLAEVDSLSRVIISPEQELFLTGFRNGHPAVWRSGDSGQSFIYRGAAPHHVDAWAMADDGTLFIGGYDGSHGVVNISDNGGRSYAITTAVGSSSPNSILPSPDYATDTTVLLGTASGGVYLSTDGGLTFEPLPWDDASPLNGALSIAYAPEANGQGIVYAASQTADEGIYRFRLGTDDRWERIAHPAGAMFGQVVVNTDGTLYASDFQTEGGLQRCLNPDYALGPSFETVNGGLEDGATMVGLWQASHRLWSTDTTNVELMTLFDSLTLPVQLSSPADNASGKDILNEAAVRDVELDWEALNGATEYRWQLDADTNFDSVLFEDTNAASVTRPPTLEPATTYYWRVRAIEPVLSPWSEKWSFTTVMGSEASGPRLIAPEAGGQDVSTRPLFQWSALADAEGYELMISAQPSLEQPVITKTAGEALPGTAWECDIDLAPQTTYYWKVRGRNAETSSAWSAVGSFTTELVNPVTELTTPPLQNPAANLAEVPQVPLSAPDNAGAAPD